MSTLSIPWRLSLGALLGLLAAHPRPAVASYQDQVLADRPVAYWSFDGETERVLEGRRSGGEAVWAAVHEGDLRRGVEGPRPPLFPDFGSGNLAVEWPADAGHVRLADPGPESLLDFGLGDSITLEAWVNLGAIRNGANLYLIGKGRTGREGVAPDNQNYALRLRGVGHTACVSFLFRSAEGRPGSSRSQWHRWTSIKGFPARSGWHHVAVTYTFGEPESLRGYLDGQTIRGRWDMGGATAAAPVEDDDEVWIGSAQGGASGNTFQGRLDEVAIHRRALSADTLRHRFRRVWSSPVVKASDLPETRVRVELIEGIPDRTDWRFVVPEASESYEVAAFGFVAVPAKYSEKVIKIDRSDPFLLRASAQVRLEPGRHRFLLRAPSAARLWVDGEKVAQTPFPPRNADGHEEVPEAPESLVPGMRYLQPGHTERSVTLASEGGPHVVILEAFVGGQGRRPELGELSVAVESGDEVFRLLSPRHPSLEDAAEGVRLTDAAWLAYAEAQREAVQRMNAERRRSGGARERAYWAWRHEAARRHVRSSAAEETLPVVGPDMPVQNPVDHFLGQRLEAAGVKPAPRTGDHAFLRRVTLDTVGRVPTPEEVEAFLADTNADRRDRVIDRLLKDPGWADHWVSYWQDVLAENPGILKPMLNNTGPFRWFLHESLLDNKPMDRWVTELIMMEGSRYHGGPAGFAMATQNDVPMAAKAQTVSQAFLGMQMSCARCHDAPYHDFTQKDLFSLAAMLERKPLTVPASSSIPGDANIIVGRLVNVSLKPGSEVAPAWPFGHLVTEPPEPDVLRNPSDSRERLAALITHPRNERFPKVIVNRVWKRHLGWGLVEPVDDWEGAQPSHPDLLRWLARDFVRHGYDLKHLIGRIVRSHAYQRQVRPEGSRETAAEHRLFASPARRRMTAEQLVDSLFLVAGKPFRSEPLNLDVDGRRPVTAFNNLGVPRHAWEFTSLSNERDRPALAMPHAQAIVDTLAVFGWRDSRQNPVSVRDHAVNVLQPAMLANGQVSYGRITRLSEKSALTEIALQSQPVEALVETLFLRILSRPPRAAERRAFVDHLAPGYEGRIRSASAGDAYAQPPPRRPVSWSNHLSPEATRIKQEREREARRGDPPTRRLTRAWRERMEDAAWALINTPEFIVIP